MPAAPLLLTAAGESDCAPGFDTPPEAAEQRLQRVQAPASHAKDLETFIRGMVPPLSDAAAVLASMHAGGVRFGHVAALARCLGDAAVSDLAVERTLRAAFQQWGVPLPGDQMSLRIALASMTAEQLV